MMSFRALFNPALYFLMGTAVSVFLVRLLLSLSAPIWFLLVIPMLLITLFISVMGLVDLWMRVRQWRVGGWERSYTMRELLWFYLRCWAVIVGGCLLALVFYVLHDLLSDDLQRLLLWLPVCFYVLCGLLTLAALLSIIRGEDLHESRLRYTQTENQMLKSQLNPHFLYNTLNNIDALIWLDQTRASVAVNELSELMRYQTYTAQQPSVTIGEELHHIEQLVALQRLRVTRPDAIACHFTVDNPQESVAPLLLMPLVENCFKHCGPFDVAGTVVLTLTLQQQALTFTTSNTLPAEGCQPSVATSRRKGGLGLQVFRRRLQLLYPHNHSFSAAYNADTRRYETRLQISLK